MDTASCRWVSGTPLGRPVVPDVYASSAVSPGRTTLFCRTPVPAQPPSAGTPATGAISNGAVPRLGRLASRAAGAGSANASTAPESATR